MKTMKKFITTTVLCALLLASFSACDVEDDNIDGQTDMPEITTVESETGDSSAPEAEMNGYSEEALQKYKKALELLEAGNTQEAYDIFLEIKDFRDVAEHLSCFVFHLEKEERFSENGDSISYHGYDDYGRKIFSQRDDDDVRICPRTDYIYDENGFLVQVRNEGPGYLAGNTLYGYDEVGNPIRQIEPDGNLVLLKYDDNRNIIYVDGWGYIQERKFDAFGNMTENVRKNNRGIWLETNVYEYNEQGDLVKETIYDNRGNISIVVDQRFEYDERGNKIKCISNETNSVIKAWDDRGNIIKNIYDENHFIEVWEYDDTGNKIKRMIKETNTVTGVWEYDDRGNLIKHTLYGSKGDYVSFCYVYDENGNKTQYYRKKATGITDRTYYEYDAYGNLLKETSVDRDPSTKDDVTLYTYGLYYKPNRVSSGEYPLRNFPEEMVGKG